MTDRGRPRGFAAHFGIAESAFFQADPEPILYSQCKVLWKGFISNRKELRAGLLDTGEQAPLSDAQLFGAACRRWGSAVQRYVLGEYSAICWDELNFTVIATHDALGLRPLYYLTKGARTLVASDLETLISVDQTLSPDEDYLFNYLSNNRDTGNRTVYRDVRLLQLGRTLIWSASKGLLSIETWSLASVCPLKERAAADFEDEFRNLVENAARTACEGRTWVELSGGLDSSTVACAAKKALPCSEITALSIIYSRSHSADEREWIREVTSKYSLPWCFLDEDEWLPFSILPDRYLVEPNRVSLMWALFREYERLINDAAVDVMLSGFGGDQVLLGDVVAPVYLADKFLAMDHTGLLDELREWQQFGHYQRSITYLFVNNVMTPLCHYMSARPVSLDKGASGKPKWLSGELRNPASLPKMLSRKMPSVGGQYFFERIWRIPMLAGHYWSNIVCGFQIRHPLLHRPLVEFMYSLPWSQKIRPGQDRVIQRNALRGILPERVRLRKDKRGPDEVFGRGLRESREVYAMLSDNPKLVELGYVERDPWLQSIRAARFGHLENFPCLMAAASMEIWLRQRLEFSLAKSRLAKEWAGVD